MRTYPHFIFLILGFLIGLDVLAQDIKPRETRKKKERTGEVRHYPATPPRPLTQAELERIEKERREENELAQKRLALERLIESNREAASASPIRCPVPFRFNDKEFTEFKRVFYNGKINCIYSRGWAVKFTSDCLKTPGVIAGDEVCKVSENQNIRSYIKVSFSNRVQDRTSCPTFFQNIKYGKAWDEFDDSEAELTGISHVNCHYFPSSSQIEHLNAGWCLQKHGKLVGSVANPEKCEIKIDELKTAVISLSRNICPDKFYSNTNNFEIAESIEGFVNCHYNSTVSVEQCTAIQESMHAPENYSTDNKCYIEDTAKRLYYVLKLPAVEAQTAFDKVQCPPSFAGFGHHPSKQLRGSTPLTVACIYQGEIRPEQCPETSAHPLSLFAPNGWLEGVWCNYEKDRQTVFEKESRLIQIIRTTPRGENNGGRDTNGKPRPSSSSPAGRSSTATNE